MLEIRIIFFGSSYFLHCSTHIAGLVTDLETQEQFAAEYIQSTTSLRDRRALAPLKNYQESGNCREVIYLYSNKPMHEFIEQFRQRFFCKDHEYSYFFNNCADAVNFTLDHFFPEITLQGCLHTTLRLLCCVGCIGTLGMLSAFPTPPGITSPSDVYRKAKLLALKHGTMEQVAENVLTLSVNP